MGHYPLLDIKHALEDAARHLDDVRTYVETMLAESAGQYPLEAQLILANVAALRDKIGLVLPSSMQTEIAMEELRYAEDDAYWSRD